MYEWLHFDRGVYLLIEWYEDHHGARVRAVTYRHPEHAPQASHLAASMGVPLQLDRPSSGQQVSQPAAATQS